MAHEHTVGTVEWEGKTYEIDWPHDPDDETQRNPIAGFIYLDGEMVGEAPAPWGMDFTDARQVIRVAGDVIRTGETDDQ